MQAELSLQAKLPLPTELSLQAKLPLPTELSLQAKLSLPTELSLRAKLPLPTELSLRAQRGNLVAKAAVMPKPPSRPPPVIPAKEQPVPCPTRDHPVLDTGPESRNSFRPRLQSQFPNFPMIVTPAPCASTSPIPILDSSGERTFIRITHHTPCQVFGPRGHPVSKNRILGSLNVDTVRCLNGATVTPRRQPLRTAARRFRPRTEPLGWMRERVFKQPCVPNRPRTDTGPKPWQQQIKPTETPIACKGAQPQPLPAHPEPIEGRAQTTA